MPPNINETDDDARHKKETTLPTQREKRRIIPQRRYIEECDYVANALTIGSEVESVNDPNSYKEAMASSDSSKVASSYEARDGVSCKEQDLCYY